MNKRKGAFFVCKKCRIPTYIKYRPHVTGSWIRFMPPMYCPVCGEKQNVEIMAGDEE